MITRRGLLQAALFSRPVEMVRLAGGTFRMGSDEDLLPQQFPSGPASVCRRRLNGSSLRAEDTLVRGIRGEIRTRFRALRTMENLVFTHLSA